MVIPYWNRHHQWPFIRGLRLITFHKGYVMPSPSGMVRPLCICVALALLLAVAPWSNAYYQALRVMVFVTGIYGWVMVRQSGIAGTQSLAWAMLGAALVFNPLLPIHLPHEVWIPINLVVAALFGVVAYRHRG